MASMRELAEHIIAVANRNNLPVTNLQIQKIMFFSLGMHIRRLGGIDDLAMETYDIPFDKWRYGPVVESIYYRFNHLKDKDITEQLDGRYSEDYQDWDNVIVGLINMDVFNLVKLSHDLPSWSDYEDDILARNFVDSYDLEEIAEDFIR